VSSGSDAAPESPPPRSSRSFASWFRAPSIALSSGAIGIGGLLIGRESTLTIDLGSIRGGARCGAGVRPPPRPAPPPPNRPG